jgi:hypothetical protein
MHDVKLFFIATVAGKIISVLSFLGLVHTYSWMQPHSAFQHGTAMQSKVFFSFSF